MSDELIGEIVEEVARTGSYLYRGPDGTSWRLTYGGAVQLLPNGWEAIE